MQTPTLRLATPADAADILAIYAPYVQNTAITFECEIPSLTAFTQRVHDICAQYPYLVCQQGGAIVGYAYAQRLFSKAAYAWNAELSIYLDTQHTGKGLGKLLYAALLPLLAAQGVQSVYSLITLPGAASIALHKRMGFVQTAYLACAGYKLDQWWDVIWMQKHLGAHALPPLPVKEIHQLDPKLVQNILESSTATFQPPADRKRI